MAQDDPRLIEALRLLVEAAESRTRAHPWAHLLRAGDARLDLSLRLPLFDAGGARLDEETSALQGELEDAVAALLSGAAAFQPGRVYCFRCGQAGCAHAASDDPRAVFTGYGPTGTPRFADFFQVLVNRRDPRMELLASGSPDLVVLETSGETLMGELLPVYRQGREEVRVHGQAAAGWYRVPDPSGRPALLAVTFQVASGRLKNGRRRYFLNVLGAGPQGETLEHLHDRLGRIPWSGAARWAQSALAELERSGQRRGRAAEEAAVRRIEGLLAGLARRLERGERARDRRTRHATVRHEEGSRPTRMAVADAVRAAEDEVLFDVRRGTIVVLGERGRAHIFNLEGKLVTSVRYHRDAISRRRDAGIWRPASPAEIELVKNRTAAPRRDGTG